MVGRSIFTRDKKKIKFRSMSLGGKKFKLQNSSKISRLENITFKTVCRRNFRNSILSGNGQSELLGNFVWDDNSSNR